MHFYWAKQIKRLPSHTKHKNIKELEPNNVKTHIIQKKTKKAWQSLEPRTKIFQNSKALNTTIHKTQQKWTKSSKGYLKDHLDLARNSKLTIWEKPKSVSTPFSQENTSVSEFMARKKALKGMARIIGTNPDEVWP